MAWHDNPELKGPRLLRSRGTPLLSSTEQEALGADVVGLEASSSLRARTGRRESGAELRKFQKSLPWLPEKVS